VVAVGSPEQRVLHRIRVSAGGERTVVGLVRQ